MICDQILNDSHFVNHNTVDHHLVVTGSDEVQTRFFKGQKHPHLHLVSKHVCGSGYYFAIAGHVHRQNGSPEAH